MKTKAGSLDQWRDFFRTTTSDIFGIIEHAIMVAASDCPQEFRLRRDRIAEKLYSCQVNRFCSGSTNRVSHSFEPADKGPSYDDDDDENVIADVIGVDGDDDNEDRCEMFGMSSKEREVNISNGNNNRENENSEENLDDQFVSNYSYREAEALNDEIEEESLLFTEVFRIKEVLLNSQDEPDPVLFESLRRLQLMALTVDILKATEIGKAVNRLRKHNSMQIRHLAQTLIDDWKTLVDEWYNAVAPIATRVDEGTPDSVNPSAVVDEDEEDDGGLPSPPLDDLAFFTAQPTSMELSDFFDGMDDDGNPQKSGGFVKKHENGWKASSENQNTLKLKQQNRNEASVLAKDNKSKPIKRQDSLMKPSKPSNTKKHNVEKVQNETKTETFTAQRHSIDHQQITSNSSGIVDVQMKLEATKRKLQERYQQAENAKRQRTIQVMELHDLPKQSLVHKSHNSRPVHHYRHWGGARR